MGYNLKNVRNGKSVSKIPKWQSLRSLALKSKFVRQFELLENLEYIYGNSCWRARSFFHTNLLKFFYNSNRHKISFFNSTGFTLGRFDVFDMLFPFLAFLKLQPIVL